PAVANSGISLEPFARRSLAATCRVVARDTDTPAIPVREAPRPAPAESSCSYTTYTPSPIEVRYSSAHEQQNQADKGWRQRHRPQAEAKSHAPSCPAL